MQNCLASFRRGKFQFALGSKLDRSDSTRNKKKRNAPGSGVVTETVAPDSLLAGDVELQTLARKTLHRKKKNTSQ